MNISSKLTWQPVAAIGVLMVAAMLFVAPKASATLAGENGPILYVEETEQSAPCYDDLQQAVPSEEVCEEQGTAVITTDPEGQDPVTAAENEDDEEVTTGTISPNDEDGNHEIVYAATGYDCIDYGSENSLSMVDTSDVVVDEEYCYFYDAQAKIYRVRIDSDRQPIGEPELVATVGSTEGTASYQNFYIELSYAPDGSNVVGVRFFYAVNTEGKDCESDNPTGPNYTIETIDLTDGTVTTLVEPKFDPFLNAGYAQNGKIYFTQLPHEMEPFKVSSSIVVPKDHTSNVWYFDAGSTTATQLTFSDEVNEYFLSVSPDSKHILVCDPYDMKFYIVDAATGELTLVEIDWEAEDGFLPLMYSPDGKSFLGFSGSYEYFYQVCAGRILAAKTLASELDDEELDSGVAIAALDNFQDAVIVNGMENPDDWAPIVATATEEPEVLGEETEEEVLEVTGSSPLLAVFAGLAIVMLAGALGAGYKNEN